MDTISIIKWVGYGLSILIFIFGFLLFYTNTHEAIGSVVAAALSAGLTLGSFIMLTWLMEAFLK